MTYIHTPSGNLDIDPTPEQCPPLSVLARGLGRVHRFSNMAEPDWTVLDHSLHVYRLLRDHQASREALRYGLAHDLPEAVLYDLASPYKAEAPQYKTLENALMDKCIAPRFGLQVNTATEALVKWADYQALFIEAVYCLGLTQNQAPKWGPYEKLTLPWPRVRDYASDLAAKYGRDSYRKNAKNIYLYLAKRTGFLNVS